MVNKQVELEIHEKLTLLTTKRNSQMKIFETKSGQRYAIWLDPEQQNIKKMHGLFIPQLAEKPRNPGGFNQKEYLAAYNCYAVLDLKSQQTQIFSSESESGRSLLERNHIIEGYQTWLNSIFDAKTANFMLSICFGESHYLDEDLKNDFRNLGLSHLLAVSGFHFELFLLPLVSGLKFKSKKPLVQLLLLGPLIFIYNWLCDFPIGLLRASIIFSSLLIGWHYSVNLSRKNILLLLIIILLLLNPFYIFQIGFQLSFFASLAIYLLVPYLKKNKFLAEKYLLQGLILSFFVQIITLPFLMKSFGVWQIAAIALGGILNLPLTIIYSIGIFSFNIYILGLPLHNNALKLLLDFLNWLIGEMIRIFSYLARADLWLNLQNYYHSYITWFVFSLCGLILAIVLIKFILNFFIKKQNISLLIKKYIPGLLLISFLMFNIIQPKHSWTVCFLDVGQGDSCLIISPEGKSILIDGGIEGEGYKTILPAMNYFGVSKIDLAIISHTDLDHCGGIIDLIKMQRIKGTILPYSFIDDQKQKINTNQIIDLCKTNQINYQLVDKYSDFNLEKFKIKYKVLAPEPGIRLKSKDNNFSSLCFVLEIEGLKILFTGDLMHEVEQSLLREGEFMEIDLLKVAHHGSKNSTSTDFLSVAKPDLAIISVGYNYYGHPAQELLERLSQYNVNIKRTDLNGAIMLELLNNEWYISTYIN